MERKIELEIFRYRPDQENEPVYQTYEISFDEEWVILDAINYIKDWVDGTLSYRWSCRMGVCGSCGMMVNGIPKLTCETFLRDYYPGKVRVEPLLGFPVERDLVIVMDDFMEKLKEIKPWIIPKLREGEEESAPADSVAGGEKDEYRQTPAQLARYQQFSMCINCMLCYSACPVYVVDNSFAGPAAIALAHRYNLDSRDYGRSQREEYVASHKGIWDCTFVGECSVVCPKNVDPAAAIQQEKIAATQSFIKSMLFPFGVKNR